MHSNNINKYLYPMQQCLPNDPRIAKAVIIQHGKINVNTVITNNIIARYTYSKFVLSLCDPM